MQRGILPFGGAGSLVVSDSEYQQPSSQSSFRLLQQPPQLGRSLGYKRSRDNDTSDYFSQGPFLQPHCFEHQHQDGGRSRDAPASPDELYWHCLEQANGVLFPGGAGARLQPSSLTSCITREDFTSRMPTYINHSPNYSEPSFTTPYKSRTIFRIGAPVVPHQAATTLSQPLAYLHLASPAKRTRLSAGDSAVMNPYYHSHQVFAVRQQSCVPAAVDPLLSWSREEARRALACNESTSTFNSFPRDLVSKDFASAFSLPPSPEPRAQDLPNSPSASLVLDCLRHWLDALQLQGEETASFAFHLWTRVANTASSQTRFDVASVVAGCLWLALKLQEHRVAVPTATRLAKIARVTRRDLRSAEMAIMSWVDWAPLSKWRTF